MKEIIIDLSKTKRIKISHFNVQFGNYYHFTIETTIKAVWVEDNSFSIRKEEILPFIKGIARFGKLLILT